MIKVKATSASKDNSIAIAELAKIAETGEEFEVSQDRLEVLLGNNPYKLKFVEVVVEEKPKKKVVKK